MKCLKSITAKKSNRGEVTSEKMNHIPVVQEEENESPK
jgi:hypothetical protein